MVGERSSVFGVRRPADSEPKTEHRTPNTDLWPVYCCTKGRAGRLTAEVLSLSPTLILEGGERPKYSKAHPDLPQRRLTESGRGVAYARNGLMAAARADGCEWAWSVDDDLFDFQERRPGKAPLYLEAPLALQRAQTAASRTPMARLVGLPVAWAQTGAEPDDMRSDERVKKNVNCYCCVALHLPSLIGIAYREELRLREDTDLSLQVLARGWETLRVDSLAYQMPICGTSTGGLSADYAKAAAKAKANARLAEIWPGLVHTGGDCANFWVDWEKAAGAAAPPARRGRGELGTGQARAHDRSVSDGLGTLTRDRVERTADPADKENNQAFSLPACEAQ